MKTYSNIPPPNITSTTRAGPNGGLRIVVRDHVEEPQKAKTQQQTYIKASDIMKKERKKQDDRVLKRLPQNERRKQQRLRRQILSDPLFAVV
ncbi:hypothetical protein KDA14_01425 [Candidatus Saccharibacteria bacterium]|nr:hypothetical protein [Candidatus Saccharibacteria bacterium]